MKKVLDFFEKIEHFFHERTGQPIEKLKADMERDYFMDADEAKAYGVIDSRSMSAFSFSMGWPVRS